jgi:hypothetical protein
MVAAHVLKSTRGSTHNIQAALVRIDFCGMISNTRCNQRVISTRLLGQSNGSL